MPSLGGLLRLLLVLAVTVFPIGAAQARLSHQADAHVHSDIGSPPHDHGQVGGSHHHAMAAASHVPDAADTPDGVTTGSKSCCAACQPAVIVMAAGIVGPSARHVIVPIVGDRQLDGTVPVRIERPPRTI